MQALRHKPNTLLDLRPQLLTVQVDMTFFFYYSQENKFCDNLDGDLLVQFLKEDIYVEADEDFLLHLVQRWVDCRPERKDWFLPLLRLIRFPLLHLDTLESLPR